MNENSTKTNTGGEKIKVLLKKGFSKTFSTTVGEKSYVAERIKSRSFDLFITIKDFFYVIGMCLFSLFYIALGMFYSFKRMPHAFTRAAQNNFRIGIEMLKLNNLIDARIRFLLSNMFYSKSPTTKFYIAYVYFLQRNFKKSLKYLKQGIDLDSSNERIKKLLFQVEEELNNKSDKIK